MCEPRPRPKHERGCGCGARLVYIPTADVTVWIEQIVWDMTALPCTAVLISYDRINVQHV